MSEQRNQVVLTLLNAVAAAIEKGPRGRELMGLDGMIERLAGAAYDAGFPAPPLDFRVEEPTPGRECEYLGLYMPGDDLAHERILLRRVGRGKKWWGDPDGQIPSKGPYARRMSEEDRDTVLRALVAWQGVLATLAGARPAREGWLLGSIRHGGLDANGQLPPDVTDPEGEANAEETADEEMKQAENPSPEQNKLTADATGKRLFVLGPGLEVRSPDGKTVCEVTRLEMRILAAFEGAEERELRELVRRKKGACWEELWTDNSRTKVAKALNRLCNKLLSGGFAFDLKIRGDSVILQRL